MHGATSRLEAPRTAQSGKGGVDTCENIFDVLRERVHA